MQNIQAPIDRRGGFEAVRKDYICIENPPFIRLCVEVLCRNSEGVWIISVAHYGEQNGDVMRDPDLVFRVLSGEWAPIAYRNEYLGINEEFEPGSKQSLDCAEFANQWDQNLKDQGFFDT